jgi:hypothetical protein
MNPLQFSITILTLFLACACQDNKREDTQRAAEVKNEVATADVPSDKPIHFLTIDKYYIKIRIKYLQLAEAKNEPEFKAAFEKILELHVKKDIANFKLSCAFFYQREKLIAGINSDFDESNKPWVKTMGEDLHLILTNMLTLPPSETVDLAMRIFACRLKGEMNEDFITADKAREFLVEFNEKLQSSLK